MLAKRFRERRQSSLFESAQDVPPSSATPRVVHRHAFLTVHTVDGSVIGFIPRYLLQYL